MNTKLNLLSSGTIEMYNDIPISLNYSIAEIQTIDKTNAAFSKTITVPGTKNNNKLLGHLFDIGVDNTYNVNTKAPCTIEVDTIQVMKGHMRIVNIRRVQDDKIEYDLEVQGVLSTMFSIVSESKLEDLDLSEFDFLFTQARVAASWSLFNSGAIPYIFPLIDRGDDSTHTVYRWNKLRPAISVKKIIDKIFAFAGYTYSSSFFDSDFFSKLIIPSNNDTWGLTQDQIKNRSARVSIGTQYTQVLSTSTYSTLQFNDDTTSPNEDPANLFNTTLFQFTVPVNGAYAINGEITFDFTNFPPNGASSSFPAGTYFGYRIYFYAETVFLGNTVVTDLANIAAQTSGTITCPISWNNYLSETTTIKIKARYFNMGVGGGDPTIRYKTSSFLNFHVAANSDMINQTVSLNNALPRDVLMRDFLTSIIKMFNLYVDVDPDHSNKLLIETRNDFYSSGRVIDWTTKLNRDEPLQASPQGGMVKEYNFKYSEDKDFWNDTYKKQYNREYADRVVTVITDFLKDKKTTEVIFAPTPCVQFMNSNRVVPAIYSLDSKGNAQIKPFKIRILYFGGIKSCDPFYLDADAAFDVSAFFSSQYTEYPFCGMVDDPYNPTLSLDWGVPKEVYWETLQYTNNNLYNKYYKQFLEEIFNNGSRLVSGRFYLTPADIASLDFRNTIHVDGINYRLNKIEDYNPVDNSLTNVELIKIVTKNTFTATSGTIYGGGGSELFPPQPGEALEASEIKPVKDRSMVIGADGNSFYPEMGQRVSGQNNFVNASASFVDVSGISNYVGSETRYVSLINSSGTIVGAASKNISIINSSGVIVGESLINISVINSGPRTITESNVIYIGDQKIYSTGNPKVYKAILSQSGTNAPTAIVLENTLGTISYVRDSTGTYRITSSGLFTANKTLIFVNAASETGSPADGQMGSSWADSSNLNLLSVAFPGGVATPLDDLISPNSGHIQIFVYP